MAWEGRFLTLPPNTVTQRFQFTVEIRNTGIGENIWVRPTLIDTDTGEKVDETGSILIYVDEDEIVSLEFDVFPEEIDAPDGTYDYNIIVDDALGTSPDISIANRSVTIDLVEDSTDGTSDDSTDGSTDDGSNGGDSPSGKTIWDKIEENRAIIGGGTVVGTALLWRQFSKR